jgi:hypothetical protein
MVRVSVDRSDLRRQHSSPARRPSAGAITDQGPGPHVRGAPGFNLSERGYFGTGVSFRG